jgi:hypothetical protein
MKMEREKLMVILCIVSAAVICLLIGLLIFGGPINSFSDNEKRDHVMDPDKHCVFVIRDISNPITNKEITEWRNETIASIHAPPDAEIGWGDPFPLNERSAENSGSARISYYSEKENKTITETPIIIAYGFSIWEINGTYVTSGYSGRMGVINSPSEEDQKVIAEINTKALAWYNTVCQNRI